MVSVAVTLSTAAVAEAGIPPSPVTWTARVLLAVIEPPARVSVMRVGVVP